MPTIGDIAQLITALVLAFNVYQSWRNGQNIERTALAAAVAANTPAAAPAKA